MGVRKHSRHEENMCKGHEVGGSRASLRKRKGPGVQGVRSARERGAGQVTQGFIGHVQDP